MRHGSQQNARDARMPAWELNRKDLPGLKNMVPDETQPRRGEVADPRLAGLEAGSDQQVDTEEALHEVAGKQPPLFVRRIR